MAEAGDRHERRFVREAILALGAERPGLKDAIHAVRDWDRVLAIARAGAVGESIWAALLLWALEEEIPEPARLQLQLDHEAAVGRNTLLLREAASFQAALDAAGIPSVILKGPGLLVAHYPDIGARSIGDVDVLVRAGDVERAVEVARGRGARVQPPKEVLRYDGDVELRVPEACEHHAPVLHAPSGVPLEIHFAIPGGAEDGSDVAGVFDRSREVKGEGRMLRVPSAADMAAIACVHVFGNHEGEEQYHPRHLADLTVLIGSGATSWDEVARTVSPAVGRKAVTASRRLLEGRSIGWLDAARRKMQDRVEHWQGVLSWQGDGLAGALRILFPARPYMASRYGVRPESMLLPLLYAWRPVRGVWRLVTGR